MTDDRTENVISAQNDEAHHESSPPVPPRGRSKLRTLLLAVGIVMALILGGLWLNNRNSDLRGQPSPATTPPPPPGLGALEVTPLDGETRGVRVDVKAPSGSAEMQVSQDPTFEAVQWVPLEPSVELATFEGYQEVFARFRSSSSATPTQPVVGGALVDSNRSAALQDPPVATVGLMGPSVVAVSIDSQRIDRVGGGEPDQILGTALDPEKLEGDWSVVSTDGREITVTKVVRSTRPNNVSPIADPPVVTSSHVIALHLDGPVTAGETIQVTAPDATVAVEPFTFEPASSRSPSVHVNQLGYRPTDPNKIGFLSAFDGETGFDSTTGKLDGPGIEFPDQPAFSVIDVDTSAVLYQGSGVLREPDENGELARGELTGSRVWALDFSTVTAPGRVRICVEVVGCSGVVTLSETATWRQAVAMISRSLHYQRSGIALGEPQASFSRPRADHAEDETVVRETALTQLEASTMADDEVFDALKRKKVGDVVEGAWGGHFDAGDWDRRIQHLYVARDLFDLVQLAPGTYGQFDLNIDESGDSVPDLVDEALWSVDLYRRMQRSDGAIRGGVEASGFPAMGVSSWEEDLEHYAFAPDSWSSYIYASVAAEASLILREIDPERAQQYEDSARSALLWADKQPEPSGEEARNSTAAQRSTAHAVFLRIENDPAHGRVFEEQGPFTSGVKLELECHLNEWCDAGWAYLRAPVDRTNPAVRANIIESYRASGASLQNAIRTTKFGFGLEHPSIPLIWGFGIGGTPHAMGLLRAYLVTGDRSFLETSIGVASTSLGANPLNQSYITGIGDNPPKNPRIVDTLDGPIPVVSGTPVYGAHLLEPGTDWVRQYFLEPQQTKPLGASLPYLYSYFDLPNVGAMSEFTIQQSHGPSIWVFGILAASGIELPASLDSVALER